MVEKLPQVHTDLMYVTKFFENRRIACELKFLIVAIQYLWFLASPYPGQWPLLAQGLAVSAAAQGLDVGGSHGGEAAQEKE